MSLGIKQTAFVMLTLGILLVGDRVPANGANTVEVDGDRISVHAEGISLGELLEDVEEKTGVQFTFTGAGAAKQIFVDFKMLPLAEGIKKILHPLSCAAVYDDMGKLRRVVILGQWKGSETRPPDGRGNKPAPSERAVGPSTEPRRPESSAPSKGLPLQRRPARLGRSSRDTSSSKDEKRDGREQATEGPSVERDYTGEGPPKSQGESSEGPPNVELPDRPPPPDSGKTPVDGPPRDRPYSVDGPPGWKAPETKSPQM
jgi:hypothetical protein